MKIKTRRYYIYYAAKVLLFVIRLLPRSVSLFIADILGRLSFMLVGKYRRVAISNLDEVFSHDHEKNVRIARDVFRNLAKNGADWIKLTSLSKKEIASLVTESTGFQHVDKALAEGKGVIVLGSHFGNWELLLAYFIVKGYKGAVVGRRIYFHKYDKFITRLRNRFGTFVIYRDESPKKVLKVLKEGYVLGILADQDVGSLEGVFVDFFERSAYTPTAPVKLAMTTGASIIPAFMLRRRDNTYKMILEEPIKVDAGGDKEEKIKKYTQAWTQVLEKYVRDYPEQWVWLHSRWKTKDTDKK